MKGARDRAVDAVYDQRHAQPEKGLRKVALDGFEQRDKGQRAARRREEVNEVARQPLAERTSFRLRVDQEGIVLETLPVIVVHAPSRPQYNRRRTPWLWRNPEGPASIARG